VIRREPQSGCGTSAGYQVHVKRGEPVCGPCRTAQNAARMWWRFRAGQQTHPRTCHKCGSVFPLEHRCGVALVGMKEGL
jgi:hypothetical protein